MGGSPGYAVVVVVLAAMLALPACAAASPFPQPAPSRQGEDRGRITLAPGQSAAVGDGTLRLRFDEVRRDSRCPTDVQCVTAGSVEVAITVTGKGGSASYILIGGSARPGSITHEGVTISLADVQPAPKGTRQIPKDEYRATFGIASDTL